MKGSPPLKILVEGDQVLFNQYSVIAVNPAKCGKAQLELATKFSDWIAGPAGAEAHPGVQAGGQAAVHRQRQIGWPRKKPNLCVVLRLAVAAAYP
jgi:ABC-type tungstate transport system permease subunit